MFIYIYIGYIPRPRDVCCLDKLNKICAFLYLKKNTLNNESYCVFVYILEHKLPPFITCCLHASLFITPQVCLERVLEHFMSETESEPDSIA